MERGGGERQEFGNVTETPRQTEVHVVESTEETSFAPIKEEGIVGPVPAIEPSTERSDKSQVEPGMVPARFSADDLSRDLPPDELDGFEDKILAGMEQ